MLQPNIRNVGRIAIWGTLAALIAAIALWPASPAPTHAYFAAAPQGRAEILAHGGGQGVRPPNTLAALDAAIAMGADVLEIDVQQTADGVLVLLHDDTLDRTTNLSGSVAQMTLDAVRRADAGANTEVPGQDFSGQGIGVPTLDEAFARHSDARWVVEIKPNTAAAATALCGSIREHRLETRVLVGSFHDDALRAFRRACPEIATSTASEETRWFVLSAFAGLSRFAPVQGVALQIPERASGLPLDHPRIIAAAHARGLRVQYWTINEPANMQRLLALGADGLITDYVEAGHTAIAGER